MVHDSKSEIIDGETPVEELLEKGVISRKISRGTELNMRLKNSDIIVPKEQSRAQ